MVKTEPLKTTHRFCVAPMIDWTDRYCRYFHRQLSRHARLYTEMVVDHAILNGNLDYLLGYDEAEHPIALQLGGSDPKTLAAAAKIGAEWGYDEINLNVGCPSDRVQSGTFGACLMKEPSRVADCVAAMAEVVSVPVTVKCRIGVDDQIPEQILPNFLEKVIAAGTPTVIIHARMAWLQGLSPKENRTVPPLDYALAARMKDMFPQAEFILNGGITTLKDSLAHLESFDGVMLGRAAYETPYILAEVDQQLFAVPDAPVSRAEVTMRVAQFFESQDVPLWRYARHMLGLFHGQKGARQWRRVISSEGRDEGRNAAWLMALAEEIEALTLQGAE